MQVKLLARKMLVASVLLLLNGCQTAPLKLEDVVSKVTGESSKQAPEVSDEEYIEAEYTVFYDQGDHLKELVGKGAYSAALKLFNAHYDFFLDNSAFTGKSRIDQYDLQLSKVAQYLNQEVYGSKVAAVRTDLSKFTQQPVAKEQWKAMSDAIEQAQSVTQNYRNNSLTEILKYTSEEVAQLEVLIGDVINSAKSKATVAFSEYIKVSTEDFFEVYPVDVDVTVSLSEASQEILSHIKASDHESIERFISTYGSSLDVDTKKQIGNHYVSKFIRAKQGSSVNELATVMEAAVKAADLGVAPDEIEGLKISFVEVTSKTLLKEGQVEFPASIDMNLPFQISKAEVKDIFTNTQDSDYTIVFDVALSAVNRRVAKRDRAGSKYLSGHKTIPNAAYTARQMEVQNAQMGLQGAQSQLCYGYGALGCSIGKAISVGVHSATLQEAQQALVATPQTLDEPIHENYEYSYSAMDVRRNLTANYYVINNKTQTYFKDTFDISETRKFNLAYDIKGEDINKVKLLKKYDSEEIVSTYEDSAMSVKVTQLLDHYVQNIGDEVSLKNEGEFRAAIMYDKNEALTSYKNRTYDARPLNDHRFDHVVVIYNPTGSLGSGFYVTPDLVLTNYHVIDGAKYVEMKLYNGHETFGKVVKSDVRLDLALVKVQEKGKPVQFYNKNSLDLGSTTEAIGHPKGLEFTVTRGVISAIRKKESIFDTGGKEVLFVQTDTAINPGNSGGPLFFDDYVIGVNDNKLVDVGTEGLGFAIHHSEVEKFLDEDF
jgi:serine protease Do